MKAAILNNTNLLLESHPIASLLPYETFDKESQLYFNKGSTGFVLQASPLTGANEETIRLLTSLITESLPETCALQCLTWASPHIDTQLEHWQAQRQNDSSIHQTLAKRRMVFVQRGRFNSLTKSTQFLVRDFQVVISAAQPGHLKGMELDRLINFREGIISALKSLGMPMTAMQPAELISFLDELINPSTQKAWESFVWNESEPLNQQIASSETCLQVTPEGLYFNEGAWDVRTYSIREYPNQWAQWGMQDLLGDILNDKLSIPCPFVLSFTIYKPTEEEMRRKASFKNTRATQQAASPLARFLPLVSKIEADWKYATHALEEGQKLVKGMFQIVAYALKDQGDNAEFAVKSLFTSKGWKVMKDKYVSLPAWLSTLPMMMAESVVDDLEKFGRLKTFLSNTAANLMPLQGEWKGSQTPRMLLFGRRGQLFYWDPFDNVEGNYNVAVIGKSGTGKSVFMQELMTSLLGTGGQVFVMDVGRSFEKACHYLGGAFLEFTHQTSLCINPFSHIEHFDETLKILRPMLAQMAAPSRKTDDYENALLEQALQAVWKEHQQQTTVTKVANWLCHHTDQRAQDLGTMLHPYTKDGMYGRFFEGEVTLNFTNPLIVLELEELKNSKDLQSVVLLTLMYHVTQKMYQGDRKKPIACIIDEAWDLLRGEATGEFVEEGCRRARKYNGSFITGTQGVDDYYKTPAAKAAFENSDWMCLLGQKGESITQLKQSGRITLDAYTERMLRSVRTVQGQYAEVMIKGPSGFAVGRLLLDPFSKTLYSSKAQEVAAVKELLQQGLKLEQAIEEVANV